MSTVEALQPYVANRLPPAEEYVAGIIGDRPSQYAKSPTIWNPAFRALDINAVYLPFDVDERSLSALMAALRRQQRYLGGNVTMPYKVAVIDLLDEVDEMARRIGAVNTIARTSDGRLVGYNTDGQGAMDSLTQPLAGDTFFPELSGRTVLLLGAGGAARAVAFYLAREVGRGRLLIANRSAVRSRELAAAVFAAFANADALAEEEIPRFAGECDLLVNATTKGQAGLRQTPEGITCLEPYSALGPADPPVLPGSDDERTFFREWIAAARPDIERNHAVSLDVVLRLERAAFFDLIYAPPETMTLRHGRWTGHRTLNGKWMNIAQAASAFVYRVCRPLLESRGALPEAYRRVVEVMAAAW